MSFSSVAILGTGSFGTSLAQLLAPKLREVILIGRTQATIDHINSQHANPKYLKSISLAKNIRASTQLTDAIGHDLIIFAVPTSATRQCANELFALGLSQDVILLSCAKGIEKSTGDRMSEILQQIFPEQKIAALSGPNHAEEIAQNMATCSVIGCSDEAIALRLQELFTLPHFRSYTSQDVAGIELGGAIKNVYAIAAGMAHGLGLGDNAVSALVTRALAEMTRLGTVLGGNLETFSGLSGVGDLLVTCFSEHSRNHRVGFAIGSGKSLEQAVSDLGMVAEGVLNTQSIYEAAQKANVRTPIIDAVYSILYQNKSAKSAMQELLSRDPRPENS